MYRELLGGWAWFPIEVHGRKRADPPKKIPLFKAMEINMISPKDFDGNYVYPPTKNFASNGWFLPWFCDNQYYRNQCDLNVLPKLTHIRVAIALLWTGAQGESPTYDCFLICRLCWLKSTDVCKGNVKAVKWVELDLFILFNMQINSPCALNEAYCADSIGKICVLNPAYFSDIPVDIIFDS